MFDSFWESVDPDGIYTTIPASDVPLYTESRNTFADVLHGLWSGSGEALKLYGTGSGQEWMADIGDWINETSFAKPDVEEYFGKEGIVSGTLTGAAQSIPVSAPIMAGGLAGSAAGALVPVPGASAAGATLGASGAATILARGLYDQNLEEFFKQKPDASPEEADSYAFKQTGIEVITELASTGVDLFTAKLGGGLTKNALKAAFTHDLLKVDDYLGIAAKTVGVPTLLAKAAGAGSVGGLSEVAAEKLQYEVDKSYDIYREAPDYFKTFMIGLVAEAPIATAASYVENRSQQKIRSNLEKGLSSEDVEQRRISAGQIYDKMKVASPEAAKLWSDYVELNLEKGPLSLTNPVLQRASSDLNIQKLEEKGIINKITKAPEEVLQESGIPTGTPETVKKVISPYGEGIAPPGVSRDITTPTVEPRELYNKSGTEPQWKKDLPLSKKETNTLMDKQVEEYQKGGELPPSKIAEVPTKGKVKAVAEPERKATNLTAQWKKPIYDNPTKIAEAMAELPEDSNTLTVEQQQAIVEKQAKEASVTRVTELSAKTKLTLKEKNELKKLQEATGVIVTKEKAKGTPQVTVQPIAQVSAKKAEAISSEITQLKESIKGPDVSEEEVVSTENKIEKLQDKLIKRDDTVVPKGEITGVDRTGAKTSVSYTPTEWTRVGMTGVLTNGNGILVKRGTRKWEFIQKGTEGERISHGFFTGQKEAIQSLSEGKLPITKEEKVKEVIKLTEPQKALVETINPEEVVGKVLAKSYLRDDPEASGVALEAITKAATTFNPEKGASFKSWAISKAKGAVLDYGKKRAEIDKMERQESSTEVDEGSEKEGTIASATKGDVAAAVPLNVEKEEKVEAPPAKSLKEVLDKHKVPAESRGKYFLDVADGKKTIESVDKELSSKKPAEEVKNAVEPLWVDTIRRPKAQVDARKAEVTKTATSILDRLGWNKIDAMMFAKDTIPDKAARDKVVTEIDNLTQNTATSILDRYIRGTEVPKEYKNLAGFLKRLLSDNNNKLNSLRIRKDPEAPSAHYDPNTHTVVLTGINTVDPTPLHEIAHAITVRELYSNDKVRQEVIDLMDLVGQEAVARGLISQENLDKVKALQKRTGQEFKKAFTNDREIETTERAILYALTNEFEFMAQPFNNKGFSQFLTTVELPSTFKKTPSTLRSAVKNIYDAIVGILAKMFSRTGVSVSDSAMKRMLELYTELAGQDTTMWTAGTKTYGIDVLESDKATTSAEKHFQTMKELEVSLKDSPTAWLKKQVSDIKDTIKDYAQSTTERLAQISQPIANHLRNMEFNISIKNQEYSKEVKPFIDKYDKLSQKDRLLLDLYLMNADGTNEYSARRDQILKDNKMLDEYAKVKKVLADIYKRRKVVGLNKTNEVEDYWPRVVKDINALRQSMKDDGSYGVIEAQIDREGLNATDREAAITSLVNTGRMPKLAFKTPSSAKERQIHVVPATWKHHYMNTSEALVHHIYENNEAIESRAMFGSTKRKQNAELRDRLYKTLESKRPESKGYNRTTKKIVELEAWLDSISDKEYQEGISEFLEKSLTNVEHNRKLKELANIEEDLKTLKVGTAAYALAIRNRNKIQKWIFANPINKDVEGVDLSPKDQSDLIKLLRGRLTQTGMTGTWAALRNLSLMSVLGNPLSAVTQLGDTSFSLSDAGLQNSLQAAFGKKVVSARDLDLAHSLREFQTGKTAAWLDWSLRRFGMTAMDKFGKELYMNAVINKAKKSSLDQFRSEWGKYLEKDTEQTYNDIKDGKDTNLVKFFAFNALSEVQPVSLSEMPMKYLTAGNGRFFYALKSYNIKLLNNLYKRFVYNVQEAKTPKERIKSLRDASKLLTLVILAGATADELKDFILGKVDSQSYSDRVIDNLLKMVMVSKFSLQKAERDGFFKSFVSGNLIPPLQLADDPIKDLRNLIDPEKEASFYTLRNIPGAGKLAYSWITDTAEKSEYSMIKSKILEDYKDGSSYGQLRRKINKYNAWARNVDEPLITFSTLRRTKKAQ